MTIMQMDAGLDTGDMLRRSAVPIEASDNRETLEKKLAAAGIEALNLVLDNIEEVQRNAEAQDDQQSSYASKLEKQEALIHWQDDAARIDRQVRAGIGRNPAYCYANGERLRVLTAMPKHAISASAGEIVSFDKNGLLVGCGSGGLLISRIQLPGKKPVSVRDLLNARPDFFKTGTFLSSTDSIS